MKKMFEFINENSTMIVACAISVLTSLFFITQEYIPAMIGLLILELHLTNVNLEGIKKIFKGIK